MRSQQSKADNSSISFEYFITTSCVTENHGKQDNAEERTEGLPERGKEDVKDREVGGKRRDAYMFLSFDPLVSLLNSLQVLKMQLHQPINLHRESNGGRQSTQQENKM